MKINTIKYIFSNQQPELRRIVVKYGLTPAKNSNDLWRKVNYLVAKFKDEMMNDLAKIHPDKDLIAWHLSKNAPKAPALPAATTTTTTATSSADAYENYSGACGCSGADGDFENANGCGCGCGTCQCEQKSNFEGLTKNKMPLIVVGSFIAIGTLLYLGTKG